MKKRSLIFTVVLGLFFCVSAKAQTNADYFAGKWNVILVGTPGGDAKMTFIFDKKDGKLTGAVQDSTGKEMSKITQIDEKDKSITAAFRAQDYDLTLTLEPLDADHVKGSLMNMFNATGTRVKEKQ